MSAKLEDLDDCAMQLRAILHGQTRGPTHATIHLAEWDHGLQTSGSTGLVCLGDATIAGEPASQAYPTLRLAKDVLTESDLVDAILKRLREHHADFQYAYQQRVIDRKAGDWPYWEFRVALDATDRRPTSEPVIAFGLPPRSDGSAAVTSWFGDDRWYGGEWRIRIPDRRARLRDARFSGDGVIHIAADSEIPSSELQIQVLYSAGSRRDVGHATAQWDAAGVTFHAPDAAELATAFLVGRSDEILDRAQIAREPRQPTAAEQLELVERCAIDIANGEREDVELKPWITPKDTKEREIVETIVAFANTGGGRLYIGITSSGVPQTRGDLFRTFKSDKAGTNAAIEARAQAWLRGLVQEKLRRHPPLEEHLIEVHGEPVLCAIVRAGDERPYATIDNEIFIRKGASNRRPDPHSELPSLVGAVHAVHFGGNILGV